jgi:hypothetical protein
MPSSLLRGKASSTRDDAGASTQAPRHESLTLEEKKAVRDRMEALCVRDPRAAFLTAAKNMGYDTGQQSILTHASHVYSATAHQVGETSHCFSVTFLARCECPAIGVAPLWTDVMDLRTMDRLRKDVEWRDCAYVRYNVDQALVVGLE